MFRILNLVHWDLFEPALVRLDWFKPSSVEELQLVVIDTIRILSVWARDLDFGAWNFHDFLLADNFYKISELLI